MWISTFLKGAKFKAGQIHIFLRNERIVYNRLKKNRWTYILKTIIEDS